MYIHVCTRQNGQLVAFRCLTTLLVCAFSFTHMHYHTDLHPYIHANITAYHENNNRNKMSRTDSAAAWFEQATRVPLSYYIKYVRHPIDTYLTKEAHTLIGLTMIGIKQTIGYIRGLVLRLCGHFSQFCLSLVLSFT